MSYTLFCISSPISDPNRKKSREAVRGREREAVRGLEREAVRGLERQ